MTEPSAVLDTPYPAEAIPSTLDDLLGLASWLDPVEYLRKGIEYVFGFNPGEVAGDWVAGDWRGVATAASALQQLAEFMFAFGEAIADGNEVMQARWTGHAADLADSHFQTVALAINQNGKVIADLSDQHQQIAASMHETAEAIGDVLADLEGLLISMGIKLLAAALLSETVVGSLIAGGWAISDAKKAVDTFAKARDIYDGAATGIRALIGGIEGVVADQGTGDGLGLPPAYWTRNTPLG